MVFFTNLPEVSSVELRNNAGNIISKNIIKYRSAGAKQTVKLVIAQCKEALVCVTMTILAAEVLKTIKTFQTALQMLTVLQFTAHMWPPQAVVRDGANFDFIVIGAGTAGIVVANRLTENPDTTVLLIEAGGNPPLESDLPGTILLLRKSQYDWKYTAEKDYHFEECHQKQYLDLTLGKMLGGTSSLNYMNYQRGNFHDYNSWASMLNDTTWNWDNVFPYFKKIERIEDQDISDYSKAHQDHEGLMSIKRFHSLTNYIEAHKELGHDITSGQQALGFSPMLLSIANGSRQSSASSYLTPIKDRSNLHVLKNTMVKKIIFDNNKKAIGVEVVSNDSEIMVLKASKEIVLSAGAINTPKLLMLSGIGEEEHLKRKNINVISNLPVGQNLQDHVSVIIIHNLEIMNKTVSPRNPRDFPSDEGFNGFVALNQSKNYPDYKVVTYVADRQTVMFFCAHNFNYKNKICDDIYMSQPDRLQAFTYLIKLSPKSRGKVQLHSSNPADPPLITPGYISDEEDLEDLIKFIQDFVPIVNTTLYRKVGVSMADPKISRCGGLSGGSKDYWRCYSECMLTGLGFFTSTCAMGSVVDSRLRVYGVQQLRIADASIMPTISSGGPYAPAIMIGEKASDFIKNDHGL